MPMMKDFVAAAPTYNSISDGVEMSFELMKNGKASDKLASYVEVSKSI